MRIAVSTAAASQTPFSTASAPSFASMQTVRVTIMPGPSSITVTCLPRAWKNPTATAIARSGALSAGARAMRGQVA